jgi:hypothetical protein
MLFGKVKIKKSPVGFKLLTENSKLTLQPIVFIEVRPGHVRF